MEYTVKPFAIMLNSGSNYVKLYAIDVMAYITSFALFEKNTTLDL